MARCCGDVYLASMRCVGAGGEIVKDVLLVEQVSCGVPAFAVFRTAAYVGLDVDAAVIEPQAAEGAEKVRRGADAITAIAGEEGRVRTV